MNKTGSAFNKLLFIIVFAFLAVYFFAPQYIGMQQSSQRHRAAISKFFGDLAGLFTFKDGPKKYGEINRESDPFKESQKRRRL